MWAFYLCFSFPALFFTQLHSRECMCKHASSWGRFRSCFNAWDAEFSRRAARKQRLQFWEISVAVPSFSQLWLQKSLSFKEICTFRHLLHLAFLHSQICRKLCFYYFTQIQNFFSASTLPSKSSNLPWEQTIFLTIFHLSLLLNLSFINQLVRNMSNRQSHLCSCLCVDGIAACNSKS